MTAILQTGIESNEIYVDYNNGRDWDGKCGFCRNHSVGCWDCNPAMAVYPGTPRDRFNKISEYNGISYDFMKYERSSNISRVSTSMTALDKLEMVEYNFRGKKMKRAPKREFYYPNEEPKTYKWGQQINNYPGGTEYSGLPMPGWMKKMADLIREIYDEPVNHCIVIKYSDGVKNHAPAHSDKLDKQGKYGFFNFSFGEPRLFQVLDEDKIIWSGKLENCSMLYMSGEGNRKYKHSVPKDKNHKGVRYSVIFRTIV